MVNVSESQFFRVLWENMDIKLTDEEQQILAQRYNVKRDGRVNWRLFCESINQPFDPHDVNRPPVEQKRDAKELYVKKLLKLK